MSSALGGGALGSIFALNGLTAPQQTISIKVDGIEKIVSTGNNHTASFSVAGGGNPLASNVAVAPGGNLSSVDAQNALLEIDGEINAMADLTVWFQNQLL